MAASYNNTEIVELLIEHGADLTMLTDKYAESNVRVSQMYFACGKGHADMVRLLMRAGCPCNVNDFIIAAESGHTELMTVLVARGLDGAGDPRVKTFLNYKVMMPAGRHAKSNSNPELLRICDAMHTAHSKHSKSSPSDALAFMRERIPGVVRERDRMRGEEAAATAAHEAAELIRSHEREAQLQAEREKAVG